MKELWRKTFELFRGYPILWLPFVCAQLATSSLTWFRRIETNRFVIWYATRRYAPSVLGGTPGSVHFDEAAIPNARRLSACFQWGTHYVNVCLFAMAMAITAILVTMILRGARPSLAAAFAVLRLNLKRILLYSLKYTLLGIVLAALIFPVTYLKTPQESNGIISRGIADCEYLLTSLCIAWVMAPIAIELLASFDSQAISLDRKKLGRYVYLLTATAAFVFILLLDPLLMKLPLNLRSMQVVLGYSLLVANFPYVFLYIALALLATEDWGMGEPGKGPNIRDLLRNLMPLHYRENPEQ